MPEIGQSIDSPFGALTIFAEDGVITRLRWQGGHDDHSDLLDAAASQLAEYFTGNRQVFDLPLQFLPGLTGDVQRQMIAIPLGETRTYGDIAKVVGASAQAVGQACGANAIPIIIPCHRVLGRETLGGFSAPGGVETKVALLKHEGAAGLLL